MGDENLIGYIPIDDLLVKSPTEGLPCIGDFITVCISYIFSGSRLHREPIDVNVVRGPNGKQKFIIKKGFTRLILS